MNRDDIEQAIADIKPLPLAAWLDLMALGKDVYRARLTTAHGIYRSENWLFAIEEGLICLRLVHATVSDPQNRGPEFAPRLSQFPVVPLDPGAFVSVIGQHSGYHLPLPRGCSLTFESKL